MKRLPRLGLLTNVSSVMLMGWFVVRGFVEAWRERRALEPPTGQEQR